MALTLTLEMQLLKAKIQLCRDCLDDGHARTEGLLMRYVDKSEAMPCSTTETTYLTRLKDGGKWKQHVDLDMNGETCGMLADYEVELFSHERGDDCVRV